MKFSMKKFIKTESASGVILALITLVALALANSALGENYFKILETKLIGWSVLHWINDGLMTIFFFVVGMEIKKELVSGELSSYSKAALPFAGAVGGMVVPALIYYYFNVNKDTLSGWAIPMATDIAFAMGVISLLGNRVSSSAKIFLLALAIVDDLGAVSIIAFFYTEKIKIIGLLGAALCISTIYILRNMKVSSYLAYAAVGVFVWGFTLYSGVHATIAGVILGVLTPLSFNLNKSGTSQIYPLENLVNILHPFVGFLIMPIFALANAGVKLGNLNFAELLSSNVVLGVGLGLLLGKPIGIMFASWVAVKFGLASKSDQLYWSELFGVSILAGIGFTMSIFISQLGLPLHSLDISKFAILIASLLSGIIGYLILRNRTVKFSSKVN